MTDIQKEEKELLPCPMCGGKAEFDCDDDGCHWINCTICSVSTDTDRHDAEDCQVRLAEIWNRRSQPEGWISVAEKKPGNWQNIIITLSTGSVVVGMRGPIGWDWAETDNDADLEATATHWMPFPAPPIAAAPDGREG